MAGAAWPGTWWVLSFDWLKRAIGLDVHNSGRVLLEFQEVTVGQKMADEATADDQAFFALDVGPNMCFY